MQTLARFFMLSMLVLIAARCAHDPDHPSQIHHPEGYGPQHYAVAHQTPGGVPMPPSVPHRFTQAEEWAKVFDDPTREAWQKPSEVVAAMRIQPGMTVVDLGAGTGYFLPHLDRAVGPQGRVVALDVEANLVGYMQARITKENLAVTRAQLVSPTDTGLEAASVDRILIVDTWHHITDRQQYARKLKRSLRKSGAIFIVDFAPELGGPGPKVEDRISAQTVQRELVAAGYKVQILEESLPYQYIVRARQP